MARTTNNTLNLEINVTGLRITAELADTTQGKDLYKLIKRNDIKKMSFGFIVKEDKYDAVTHTRRILKIEKLYDVSAVDTPAYLGTSLTARDYFTAQEQLKDNIITRRKLMLLTY